MKNVPARRVKRSIMQDRFHWRDLHRSSYDGAGKGRLGEAQTILLDSCKLILRPLCQCRKIRLADSLVDLRQPLQRSPKSLLAEDTETQRLQSLKNAQAIGIVFCQL